MQISGANSHQQQTAATEAFETLISAIANANVSEAEKGESRSLLLKILNSKAVATALGAGAEYLARKLSGG